MGLYGLITERQQAIYNRFSEKFMFYAYSNEQAAEGAARLGLDLENTEDVKKLKYIGAGAYCLAGKVPELLCLFRMANDELRTACTACGPAGYLLAVDMFKSEMFNHEYGLTWDDEETIQALPFTAEEIQNNPDLLGVWEEARAYVIENTF